MITQSYQFLIQRGLLLVRSEQGCLLQKLCTFEGWTLSYYDFFVVSMLWIWNMYPSKMDCAQNPPSTESYELYLSLCNAKSHLHSVPSVSSTPLESVGNEVGSCKIWFRQSSCHPHCLRTCLISRMQNKHITFMTIHCNAERWWRAVTSRLDVMVIYIKLPTNLSIFQ